jgi:glutamate carboxypeptidase
MSKISAVAAGLLVYALAIASGIGLAQPAETLRERVQRERPPLLDTMRELVSIESGSGDIEGLTRIGGLIASRLRALGAEVDIVPPADVYRMEDTPEQIGSSVVGRFRGTGTTRILLLAHMDTVYLKGMLAQQPFRIEGNRARGLGIADDKHGVALALHALAVLQGLKFREYALVTVLINADEEVSSPGSRSLLTRLGKEHDVVFSLEGAGEDDRLRLTTSGIGAATLTVTGRASHAGSAPEAGRNALYELAHQMLQTRDLSDRGKGLKLNWTVASGGTNRNVIPEQARAMADVRVLDVADYDVIERQLEERIRRRLIPDTKVELRFERRRPPLRATPAARRLAQHARKVYAEIGQTLNVGEVSPGGGTDAAFAALETAAPVIEGFGLRGGGAHSNGAEWVDLDSIEPRLYLLCRMIIDVSRGLAPTAP